MTCFWQRPLRIPEEVFSGLTAPQIKYHEHGPLKQVEDLGLRPSAARIIERIRFTALLISASFKEMPCISNVITLLAQKHSSFSNQIMELNLDYLHLLSGSFRQKRTSLWRSFVRYLARFGANEVDWIDFTSTRIKKKGMNVQNIFLSLNLFRLMMSALLSEHFTDKT